MNPPQQPPQNRLRLEYPPNQTATYANAAIVNSTHSEIILDFLQILPNDPRAKVTSRIALTPANAKLLMKALQDNLSQFEAKHGEITLPPKPTTLADQLFQAVKPGQEGTADQPDAPKDSDPDPAQE
ncbi:MAG: DUF3467 domain-containing protein [Anaerolineae bacterium]|nr:DUF3467 domain-containing protein [Anaerolineae bacterium]